MEDEGSEGKKDGEATTAARKNFYGVSGITGILSCVNVHQNSDASFIFSFLFLDFFKFLFLEEGRGRCGQKGATC